MMLECEHGDHPDYKFPVVVEFVPEPGVEYDRDEKARGEWEEVHALIYTDGTVAVTMHECCYAMWALHDGMIIGGSLWKNGRWRMNESSLPQAKESK